MSTEPRGPKVGDKLTIVWQGKEVEVTVTKVDGDNITVM